MHREEKENDFKILQSSHTSIIKGNMALNANIQSGDLRDKLHSICFEQSLNLGKQCTIK